MKAIKSIKYNAPVTLTFVIVCAVILGLNYLTGGWTNTHLFSVYASSMLDPLFYVRLFGHVLGHANLAHYANNMMLLLLTGPLLEEKYGSQRLLIIMGITALVTGIFHCIFQPGVMLLGASGVVFCFILLASVTGTDEGIPLTLIIVAIIYIGEQVYNGFATPDNISQITHIIGGIIGAGCGMALRPKAKTSTY